MFRLCVGASKASPGLLLAGAQDQKMCVRVRPLDAEGQRRRRSVPGIKVTVP